MGCEVAGGCYLGHILLKRLQTLGGRRPTSMRADGVNSADAGAYEESKPPAFQIIVLVSKIIDLNSPAVNHAIYIVSKL